MADALDPLTKELVGIAAAVAGHCQPCFTYHHREALKFRASSEAIQEAVEMARAVREAGDRHMDEFVVRRLSGSLAGVAETGGRSGDDER